MKRRFPQFRHALLALLATLLGAIAVVPAAALAQQPGVQVEARLTRTEATVGDRVGLEIIVRAPPGVTATAPDLPLRVGDLDLIERLPDESAPDGSERRLRYVLSPFQTGDLFVPSIVVRYSTTDGREATVQTNALPLRVTSVIPPGDPATTVRDLRPQAVVDDEPLAIPWPLIAASAGGLAALIILLRMLRWLFRRTRSRGPALPVYLTPEDAAHAALDELTAAGTPTRRTLKHYYTALSTVVRRYLTERYDFPALALTTTEMESRMTVQGLDRWQARLVAGLLTECDSVRYAQYVPARQRTQHDLGLAYEIVELGRPKTMLDEDETPAGDAAVAEVAIDTGNGDPLDDGGEDAP